MCKVLFLCTANPLYVVCRACSRWIVRATPLTQAAGVSPLTLENLKRLWVYKEQMSISFFHQFDVTIRAFTSMICIFLVNLCVLFQTLLRSLLFSGISVMDYYVWALSVETVTAYCPIQHVWGWGLDQKHSCKSSSLRIFGDCLEWLLRCCWQCRAAQGAGAGWGPALSAAHAASAGWHCGQKFVQRNLTENSSTSFPVIKGCRGALLKDIIHGIIFFISIFFVWILANLFWFCFCLKQFPVCARCWYLTYTSHIPDLRDYHLYVTETFLTRALFSVLSGVSQQPISFLSDDQ